MQTLANCDHCHRLVGGLTLLQHDRQMLQATGLLRTTMAKRAQKTDRQKGDEVLRRLLNTPPEPKTGKTVLPESEGHSENAQPLENRAH